MATAEKCTNNNNGITIKIADELRNLLVDGALSPGFRLGQAELAERFHASAIPVREALKLLSSEGLVDHDLNRGFYVPTLSSAEARQLFRMRHLFEDELLQSVEWPSERYVAELNALAAEMEVHLNARTPRLWSACHRHFHNAIFELSPNKIMVRETKRLWSLTDRFRGLLPIPQCIGRHEAGMRHPLVEALMWRSREALIRIRRERRTAFEELVLEILESRDL